MLDEILFENLNDVDNLIVCGATGTGKTSFLQSVLISFSYTSKPEDLRVIIIDFSTLDFASFHSFPFLLTDIVRTSLKALDTLKWVEDEMNRRFMDYSEDFPHIVIFINDMAMLNDDVRLEFERLLNESRLKAKSTKIHFFAAGSLPYATKISPLNGFFSSKICFFVPNSYNSVSIIGESGAEKLMGDSEYIYKKRGAGKSIIMAPYVSDRELEDITDYLKSKDEYHGVPLTEMRMEETTSEDDEEDLFCLAGRFVTKNSTTSIHEIQRKFKIGFNRAIRIMDKLCDAGVVSDEFAIGRMVVLMSEEEFEEYISKMM